MVWSAQYKCKCPIPPSQCLCWEKLRFQPFVLVLFICKWMGCGFFFLVSLRLLFLTEEGECSGLVHQIPFAIQGGDDVIINPFAGWLSIHLPPIPTEALVRWTEHQFSPAIEDLNREIIDGQTGFGHEEIVESIIVRGEDIGNGNTQTIALQDQGWC